MKNNCDRERVFCVQDHEFSVIKLEQDRCEHHYRCFYKDDTFDTLATLVIDKTGWFLYIFLSKKLWGNDSRSNVVTHTIEGDNKSATVKVMVLDHLLKLINEKAF